MKVKLSILAFVIPLYGLCSEVTVSILAETSLRVTLESVYRDQSQIYVQIGTEKIPDTVGVTGVILGTFDFPFPSTFIQFTFDPVGEGQSLIELEKFNLNEFLAESHNHWIQSYEFKGPVNVSLYPWIFSQQSGWIYMTEPAISGKIQDVSYYYKVCYTEEFGWFINYTKYFPTPDILIPMEWGYPFNL